MDPGFRRRDGFNMQGGRSPMIVCRDHARPANRFAAVAAGEAGTPRRRRSPHPAGAPLRRLVAGLLLALWPGFLRAAPALFVEATVTPNPVDVAAQAVYTLRFFQAVDFQQRRIRPPQARLAEIRPLDAAPDAAARYSERVIDGMRYRVWERRYAVLPFASGALAISGAVVSGRSAGGPAAELAAPELTLTVAAAPPAADWPAGASWLPARRVDVHEAPSATAEAAVLKLGDALVRTLRIEAEGLDAAALPELAVEAPGWRVHADPPVLANRIVGDSIVGVRSQRFHWVATSGGALALPPLRVDWWNVDARAWQRSALPARALTVIGPVAPTAGPRRALDVLPAEEPARAWLIGAAALLTLLFGWAALRRHRLRLAWRRRQARLRLLDACRRDSAREAREALLTWAGTRWPAGRFRSTTDVAACLPAATPAIRRLEAALYGRDQPTWRGDELAAAVRLKTQARF